MNASLRSMPSPNFDARATDMQIDILVIHYTGMTDAGAALDRLCDPAAKVSAHYLIDEDGQIIQLVDEHDRAWHAGVSAWRGETDVNNRSIGIELVNPGHEFGYRPFPEAQMAALEAMAHGILRRHPIPARNVVGHSDVAPGRKQDPGELFDWQRLAAVGVGLWPGHGRPEEEDANHSLAILLEQYGYSTEDLTAAIRAFQRHFRAERIDGIADAETVRCAQQLLHQAEAA